VRAWIYFAGLPAGCRTRRKARTCGIRIFAWAGESLTLSGEARGRGVLKLTMEQQVEFVSELAEVFEPVEGGWGRMGMTYILLERADEQTMRGALATAHRNVATKQAAAAKKPKTKQAKLRSRS
jgi:hypothetical protein